MTVHFFMVVIATASTGADSVIAVLSEFVRKEKTTTTKIAKKQQYALHKCATESVTHGTWSMKCEPKIDKGASDDDCTHVQTMHWNFVYVTTCHGCHLCHMLLHFIKYHMQFQAKKSQLRGNANVIVLCCVAHIKLYFVNCALCTYS